MSRTRIRLAWAGGGLAVVLLAVAVVLLGLIADPQENLGTPWLLVWLLIWPAFALVGARIAASQPDNGLGWLLLGVGLCGAAWSAANGYVEYALTRPAGLPGTPVAGWVVAWVSGPMFPGLFVLLPLLFPDGHPPGRRWRILLWLGVAGLVVLTVAQALRPGPVEDLPVDNPLGVQALAGPTDVVYEHGTALLVPLALAAFASQVVRFRRAGVVERQQIKWIVAAMGLMIATTSASVLVMAVAGDDWGAAYDDVLSFAQLAPVLLVPVAIGIAVTRYRLYEIDRIISRTVTYALVTAALVAVYAAVAVLPSALLDVESDLLVAAATLAAAGVFVPVRRQVQQVVDRRFNRARYDAARVVERFGDRLRDDLDVDGLAGDLRGVVAATVQPAHVSVWLVRTEDES
ncbi:hypothetical protein BH23ACT10_BH23ACT10_16340 [soil metagenome]